MPLPYSFDNSKASSVVGGSARIETGMIVNVNPAAKTVDWAAQYSGRLVPGLQISSPYLHYNNGEGFTVIPDLGALCAVCWPSDGESPFVLGFLEPCEQQTASSTSGGDQMTASTGSSQTADVPVQTGYNAGRPVLNPGDMYWQGRDDNFIVLRRGGVLQLGATNVCQRAYIPISNIIRDFCENWELNTAAGLMSWHVHTNEKDPGGLGATEFLLVAREYAQDKMASVKVSIGSLNDSKSPPGGGKTLIEMIIAPQNVDPVTGVVKTGSVYELRLDKVGNSYSMQAQTRTVEVKGDDVLVVSGKRDVSVGKDDVLRVTGNSETTISGAHSMTGSGSSTETWDGIKTISGSAVKVGGSGASHPAILGDNLYTWLVAHVHSGGGSGPPVPPLLTNGLTGVLSTKVLIDE